MGTEFTADLDKTGIDDSDSSRVTGFAIINAIVGPVQKDGRAVINGPRGARALIDTGATTSAVDKTLAESIGLEVVGRERGIVMDGRLISLALYRARLELPDLARSWDELVLMESGGGQGIHDVIIGNDILQSCFFTIDGPNGKFTFSVPG